MAKRRENSKLLRKLWTIRYPNSDTMKNQLGENLTLAVWFGLLTGATEVIFLAVKKFYLGQIIRVSLDIVWMSPLADTAIFLVPAVAFSLLSWWRPKFGLLQGALFVFAFLSFLSLILMYYPVELYAKVLLAAGLAVQTARIIARRPQKFHFLVGRTLPWMAGFVIVLAASVHGWRWIGLQQAVAQLPQSPSRAPNVLLIILDTVRAQSLSLYGYHRQTTPNLDRWAKTAVVFERAISPSPWTFPAHASIFTGRWPHELSANWKNPLDAKYPTVAEVLRDKGYLTAGFAANTFYCTHEFGIDRGFIHYEDYTVSPGQLMISSSLGRLLLGYSLDQDFSYSFRQLIGYYEILGRKSAGDINDAFLRWLSQKERQRPFFVFLNYLDAHQPFLPPGPFDVKFRDAKPRGDPRHWWGRQWSPQEIQTETDSYDGTIAYMDDQLGLLFDELKRRGELDNTLVIITSDHGEHLGEHGFMRHANTLYLQLLHVPLMIVFPAKITTGVTVREPVTLRDIPATVLALLNLECEKCFPGKSLTRYWMNEANKLTGPVTSPTFSEVSKGIGIPDRYPNAKGDMKSLIDDEMHYIKNGDGSEELYDLEKDPQEDHNIAGSINGAPGRERLKSYLESIIQRGGLSKPMVPSSSNR